MLKQLTVNDLVSIQILHLLYIKHVEIFSDMCSFCSSCSLNISNKYFVCCYFLFFLLFFLLCFFVLSIFFLVYCLICCFLSVFAACRDFCGAVRRRVIPFSRPLYPVSTC